METTFDKDHFLSLLENHKFSDALKYTHDCVPDHLYKWYALNSYNDISEEEAHRRKESDELRFKSLVNQQNWFDTRFKQNDPFDMALYELDYDKLKEKGLENYIEIYENVINLLRDNILLCSFCDSEINNLPMWANYANAHQGYCIKYRILNKKIFFKILYEPKIIKVYHFIFELVHDAVVSYDQKHLTNNTANLRDMLYLLNNCKHKSWEYENEYRCLYPIIDGEMKGQNVSNATIGVEPVEIYIGINCSDENKERLIQLAHNVLNCKVNMCKLSKTKFLDFEEC